MAEVRLNSGYLMPQTGLGTAKSFPGEVERAVEYAVLDAGYRHLDCALYYDNQESVGVGLRRVFASGRVRREELFVTSKLWRNAMRPDLVRAQCLRSLALLGLTFLDLYLIHWPVAVRGGDELDPRDAAGELLFEPTDIEGTWRAMEALVDEGLVRSIGLSNFSAAQVDEVLALARIRPACNQIEVHPYLRNEALVRLCKARGVEPVAYSPLGTADYHMRGEPWLLEDPVLGEVARKHGTTPAVVCLRWVRQRGLICVPKSVTPARIQQNMHDVARVALDDEDMARIDALDRNFRFVPEPGLRNHPRFPFAPWDPQWFMKTSDFWKYEQGESDSATK